MSVYLVRVTHQDDDPKSAWSYFVQAASIANACKGAIDAHCKIKNAEWEEDDRLDAADFEVTFIEVQREVVALVVVDEPAPGGS
jgi:hypothetical protein